MQNKKDERNCAQREECEGPTNHGPAKQAQCQKHATEPPESSTDDERPWQISIVEYDGKLWIFDEYLRQIRNIENPQEYEDLNDQEMFIFKYQGLLKDICECTDSSVAGLILELLGMIAKNKKGEKHEQA